MALELDDRQRAMLEEMGVRVWLPGTAFATEAEPVPARMPATATAAPATAMAPAPAARVMPTPSRTVVQSSAPVAPLVRSVDASGLDWDALVQTVSSCQACPLGTGRKNVTLQPPAQSQMDWMVVGDPPDEDEDRAGQPFAEAQGLLLDNMLKAVGASRSGQGASGAYVTNVVKCRPPHGRIAQPADLAQCAGYLQREMTLVQPKMILAMGRFATQLLLGEYGASATLPLGKLRGTAYQYQGIPVVVTYAPKVLLRASADKGKAWADLCLAMDTLEAS
jgi:DNA polymerase